MGRWRYATGTLAIPCVIGGVTVLDTHPLWAYSLFAFSGVSIVWGIWPLIFPKREKPKEQILRDTKKYVDKIIVDSKVPAVLEITGTLQKMADRQNMILNNSMRGTLRQKKLIKIQQYLQRKLDIKPGDPKLGDAIKVELLSKQIKRLKLSSEEFNEEHIKIFVAITWALDWFNVGLPQKLDVDEEYKILNGQLNTQSQKISGGQTKELILTYQDIALGWNSATLYVSYFPEPFRANMPPQIRKSIRQMKYERGEVLQTLLQKISKEVEGELCGIGVGRD